MAGQNKALFRTLSLRFGVFHSNCLSVVTNLLSFAFVSGYLTIEYIWPYIKRRFLTRSEIQRRLQLKEAINLTKYEEDIALGALHPSDIRGGFGEIGGNEAAIIRLQQITDLLLSPPRTSRLMSAPSGILLYGPPGCGKTMIARALAKESGLRFISVNLATVMDKWVGETEKYIEALFTLGQKISPVIIFVDEIDALTRRRDSGDREWSAGMKSQLLTYWDGLGSSKDGRVIILGATNRPQDIDEAFLRRMPLQIKIDLPGQEQRSRILQLMFEEEEKGIIDYDLISHLTESYSGSDLHELARRTVMNCTVKRIAVDTQAILEELQLLQVERLETKCF